MFFRFSCALLLEELMTIISYMKLQNHIRERAKNHNMHVGTHSLVEKATSF